MVTYPEVLNFKIQAGFKINIKALMALFLLRIKTIIIIMFSTVI